MKFTKEYIMCTEKYVLVKRMFINILNMCNIMAERFRFIYLAFGFS